MSATNYIYQFAGDVSALVLSDGDYSSDSQRPIGNQPGIARADFVNKALRQSTYMAAVLAQYMVDYAVEDVLDSESVTLGVGHLVKALGLTTGFPAGTKMVFYQAVAPLHWTQDTTNTDMALRVVNTAGGGIGGTHNLSSPPSLAHTHTTGSFTLTSAEVPAHTHTVSASGSGSGSTSSDGNHYHQLGDEGGSGAARSWGSGAYGTPNATTTYAGTHSHSVSVSVSVSGSTSSSGSGGSHNHGATASTTPTSYAPKYIDVIVCTKD